MNKHVCPNCDMQLTYEYMEGSTENDDRIWYPYWMCSICSFGYPVSWEIDE